MNKLFASIILRDTFEEGQIICAQVNYERGLLFFFKATDYDVENYSGKGNLYLVIIKQ